MTEAQAADILLVRAVEESDRTTLPPEAIVDAVVAAGDPIDPGAWFTRRAQYLLDHDLTAYRSLLRMAQVPSGGWVLPVAVPLLLGLAANYLGPQQRIHVLANPIVLLIGWNLLVYALVAGHGILRQRHEATPSPAAETSVVPIGQPAPVAAVSARADRSWLLKMLLRRALEWWLSVRADLVRGRHHLATAGRTTRRFTRLWMELMAPRLGHSLRRVFHLGAIGLTTGAIAGMYLRGLFFDYAMVWRSTFITSPDLVASLLRFVLRPACLLSGQPFPTSDDAIALMSPAGVPAGWWIHLYALSAILLVIFPRALLAGLAHRNALRARRRIDLSLDAPYFHAVLDHARGLQVQRVRDEIHSSVADEIDRLADGIATLVCEELFDRDIVRCLREFRETGGPVAALERAMAEACSRFQPTLGEQLPPLLGAFEASVLARVEVRLGRRLGSEDIGHTDLASTIGASASSAAQDMGRQVGASATDLVGVTVTGAVGAVAAVISGGIGHHLGLAIVAALLHTSGPVGLLLGGMAGLLVAGIGWWQGRAQITEAMKDIPLPGAMVRLALWSSRFERLLADGRSACGNEVRTVVQRELSPLTDALAEQIWTRIRAVLGARASVTTAG